MPTLPGGMELVVIAILIVVLFGWKKLPDAARSLGRSMRIFKAEVEEMKDKPSAASRDTVSGEARRGETYRAGEARDRHD
ncbi:MAG: Sec-independent protein translocase subunit TatA, partial [Mobilicoccus sp.]|nr:Sec-independent protein translocase subunit TatA [Mobilicoccus sp.]